MAGTNVGSIEAEATLNIDQFLAAAGSLDAAAAAMAEALGAASTSAASFEEALASLGGAVPAAFEELTSSAQSAGLAAGNALAAGISASRGAASSAAASTVRAAVSAMASGAGGARSVGAQISAGLASGIASGRSAVIAAAISVAQAAIDAARARLQIHSPSRVTTEFGEAFDLGMVRGMLNLESEVARTVERVTEIAAPASASGAMNETTVVVNAPTETIDYDRLAAAFEARRAVIEIDGQAVAAVSAGAHAREQDVRRSRLAARRGLI